MEGKPNTFLKSVLLQPPKIFGRKMRPFSIYHSLVLTLLSNPYAVGGYPLAGDMIQVLLVCSQGYEDKLSGFLRWSNSRLIQWFWKYRLILCNQTNLDLEIRDYIRQFSAGPEFWTSSKTRAKHSGAPMPFHLASVLMAYLPQYSPAEIWNMSLTVGLCHRGVMLEESQSASIADREIEESEMKLREAEEREKRKQEEAA